VLKDKKREGGKHFERDEGIDVKNIFLK